VKKLKKILKDESGQGMLEYVLILFIVLFVGVMFKQKIQDMFSSKTDAVVNKANDVFQ